MSKIKVAKSGKPIWKESEASYNGRFILVGLEPRTVVVRLKGTRQELRLPISLVYQRAAEIEAAQGRPQRRKSVKRNLTCGLS